MADIQKTLQTLSDDYSKLQTGNFLPSQSPFRPLPTQSPPLAFAIELQSTIDARQKLESQHQENKGVAREFGSFSSENKQQGGGGGVSKIYKLVGPVLLAQDKSEAILAVQARLDFIEKEMYVLRFRSFFSFSFPFCFLHYDGHTTTRGLPFLLTSFPNTPPPILLTRGEKGGRRDIIF